jgi:hypothetical protein
MELSSMGRMHLEYFPLGKNHEYFCESAEQVEEEPSGSVLAEQLFVCRKCGMHIALGKEIFSRDFHGASGTAYLFNYALNCLFGEAENRKLRTGWHTVADAHCAQCNTYLGWKYMQTVELSQKYKVGKFILELAFVRRINDGRGRKVEQQQLVGNEEKEEEE